MVTTQYDDLTPGLYVQVGGGVHALKTRQDGKEYLGSFEDVLHGTRKTPSLETLASEVAWVYVALRRRRAQLLEIDAQWQQGENELDPGETPYSMPWRELLQQIDESMQLYSQAYLLKQRIGRRVVGIRWLDPLTITPDYDTADVKRGILRYKRKRGLVEQWLPAEDVIRFVVPGMRELRPAPSAGRATSLAGQILHGIAMATDVFFENNALPVALIEVPPTTTEPDRLRLQDYFKRIFNSGRGATEQRTIAVAGAIKVHTLSFTPSELMTNDLEENKIVEILAAHDVPKTIAMADAANYATDVAAARRFVGALSGRLEYIAETFAADPDLLRDGYRLVVMAENHYSMKEDEAARATAFKTYVEGGMTPEAAAYLVGITQDDLPDDIMLFDEEEDEPGPVPAAFVANMQAARDGTMPGMVPSTTDDNGNGAGADLEAKRAEMRQFRRWLRKRRDPDPRKFTTYHMTLEEKDAIIDEMLFESGTADYDDVARSVREFLTWADENDPELADTLTARVIDPADGNGVLAADVGAIEAD